MMDGSGLYPKGFHPVEQNNNREFTGPAEQMYTRTQLPPKYYWIDFGNSARFDPSNRSPRIAPVHGTDKSAPEFQDSDAYEQEQDPFPTDIYYLGNLMRMHFTEVSWRFYTTSLGTMLICIVCRATLCSVTPKYMGWVS
jgi:hypothetical protein